MRQVVAANLNALITKHYPAASNRPKVLKDAAHCSFSSAQRWLAGETGLNLDAIESIAEAFDLSAYQLLLPELDVNNPQVVQGASKAEQRAYRAWRQSSPHSLDGTLKVATRTIEHVPEIPSGRPAHKT